MLSESPSVDDDAGLGAPLWVTSRPKRGPSSSSRRTRWRIRKSSRVEGRHAQESSRAEGRHAQAEGRHEQQSSRAEGRHDPPQSVHRRQSTSDLRGKVLNVGPQLVHVGLQLGLTFVHVGLQLGIFLLFALRLLFLFRPPPPRQHSMCSQFLPRVIINFFGGIGTDGRVLTGAKGLPRVTGNGVRKRHHVCA